MKINLSPQRRDERVDVGVYGDQILVNGEAFNFAPLPDGATINGDDIPCEFIVGEVSRQAGEIHLTLILPHGPNPESHVAFPMPVTVFADGPVYLPGQEEEVYEDVDA